MYVLFPPIFGPVMIWNSLVPGESISHSEFESGVSAFPTAYHFYVIGNKAYFLLDLETRMPSLFEHQISRSHLGDYGLDIGRWGVCRDVSKAMESSATHIETTIR